MKLVNRFFILFILYIIGLFFYTWRNLLIIKKDTYPEKNLYKDMIKTGDIFLMANTKNHKIFGDLIFMIDYFHPSIALWEEERLYILEYAFYPNMEKFNKIPFNFWLRYNKNKKILHCPLHVPDEMIRKRLGKKINNFFVNNQGKINKLSCDFGFDWIRFVTRTTKDLNLKSISCTEVLAMLIYETGIARKNKGISYYHQSDFVQLKNFSLNEGFSYPESYKCNLKYLIENYI